MVPERSGAASKAGMWLRLCVPACVSLHRGRIPDTMGDVAANITFGSGIPGDAELRLCGDVSEAKRAVELGVFEWYDSV